MSQQQDEVMFCMPIQSYCWVYGHDATKGQFSDGGGVPDKNCHYHETCMVAFGYCTLL